MVQIFQIKRLMPNIGCKKIRYILLSRTENMKGYGRDKFFALLRLHGLLNKRYRRHRYPGTDSKTTQEIFPNLKAEIEVSRPNQLIESDITCIRINGSYKPLFVTMDIYSRKILGWNLSHNWTSEATIKPLLTIENLTGCIHHSDRGIQYGSKLFVRETRRLGMRNSMSRKATPTDEAHIERVNGTLKREFGLRRKFSSFEEAKESIKKAVKLYNDFRPHWSLGLKTPSEVYETGKI